MRSQSRESKPELLGNHQRCWIWGRNAVRETILAENWEILELATSSQNPADRKLVDDYANRFGTVLSVVSDAELTKICKANDHQGWAAKMTAFPYRNFQDFTKETEQQRNDGLFVVLDHLQDAFNFGAIIRSAAAFHVSGIVIARKGQVGVTSQVTRSSAGLVNSIPIYRVDKLADAMEFMKQLKGKIFGTAMEDAVPIDQTKFSGLTAIVIGTESTGISADIMNRCDARIRIPIADHVESLNAAVASGILFYEINRQRGVIS